MLWVWSIITGNMNLVLVLSVFLWGNSVSTDFGIQFSNDYEDSLEDLISIQPEWEQYKAEFDKLYDSTDEEIKRLKIYLDNSKMIEEHNELYHRGVYTYELGHNAFSDLSYQEYLDLYSQEPLKEDDGYPLVENMYFEKPLDFDVPRSYLHDEASIESEGRSEEGYSSSEEEFQSYKPPLSIDWRQLGGVTPVKMEGACGAHWAFSAIGSLEGQLFRKYHHLTPLSEQNLIDCAGRKYGNKGCKNGTALNAFKYIIHNKGIDTNVTYPYKGKTHFYSFCKYKKLPTNPQVHAVQQLQRGNETNLATVVARSGPVSVAIDATGNKFRFYTRGVYNNPHCNSFKLTREMVVVGYAPNYFIIKNSWGRTWGLSGYILLGRTGHNQCGIATRAVLPIV